jgi:hypothetical protein
MIGIFVLLLSSTTCLAAYQRLSNGAVMATVLKPDPVLSHTNPLHSQGQGDMLVHDNSKNRNVIARSKQWANKRVPYDLTYGSAAAQKAFLAAARDIESLTCVRFVPRTSSDKNYVQLVSKNGCYSYMGNINYGAQELSLGQGCEYSAVAAHELGHALGLIHEHQRADRDNYITVYIDNVPKDQQHNFLKSDGVKYEVGDVQGGAYCYNSIMHYTGDSFAAQGKISMASKLAGVTLGQTRQQGLTDYDVEQIKKYYGC